MSNLQSNPLKFREISGAAIKLGERRPRAKLDFSSGIS